MKTKNIEASTFLFNNVDIETGLIYEALKKTSKDIDREIIIQSKDDISSEMFDMTQKMLEMVDTIICPGTSWSIYTDSLGLEVPEQKQLLLPSVKRKLQGLTPRGIDISDEDLFALKNISSDEKIAIIDDVVASGTTINGLTKRLGGEKTKNTEVSTLVLRTCNDLRKNIRQSLNSAFQIDAKYTNERPAIITLDSFFDTNKRDALYKTFVRKYGEDVSNALFTTIKK